jgi:hypothetical protein
MPALLGPAFDVSGLLVSGWTLQNFADVLQDNVLAFRPNVVVI